MTTHHRDAADVDVPRSDGAQHTLEEYRAQRGWVRAVWSAACLSLPAVRARDAPRTTSLTACRSTLCSQLSSFA